MKTHSIMWALAWHSIRIRRVIRGPVKHPAPVLWCHSVVQQTLRKGFFPLPLKVTQNAFSFLWFLGFPFMNITNLGTPFSPTFESGLSKSLMPGPLGSPFWPASQHRPPQLLKGKSWEVRLGLGVSCKDPSDSFPKSCVNNHNPVSQSSVASVNAVWVMFL